MIKELKKTDISGLNRLAPEEWKFDYERFLNHFLEDDFFFPFVMVRDNKIIGTGNVFLKEKIGWLANIIIDKEYRCKGLGYKMTKYLTDFLQNMGCETQLLLATELGEPVYKKMGFRKLTDYQSFESVFDMKYHWNEQIRKLDASDKERVYELDLMANGENRKHLIDKFYQDGLGFFSNNELIGFYLPNFGRGLVISKEKQAGKELLRLKHSNKGKRTFIPIENQEALNFFEENGIEKGYKCSRMILGKENQWKPE